MANRSDSVGISQMDSLRTFQRLDVSYAFGVQIKNENFIYNPGIGFQMVYGLQPKKDIGIGIGTGYQSFNQEQFIPVFFEIYGYTQKKKNTPVIKTQLGYSLGWYDGNVDADEYSFKGGFFMDAGVAMKYYMDSKYALQFELSYRHQFASMDYVIYNIGDYSEELNYDMILITISIHRDR